jgi:hypothetical protein
MTLLNRYSSLADQSSSSPSSDSFPTPWNMTYGNSCKKIKSDPKVGSIVMAFLTCYSSLANQSSLSPGSNTIATLRKTATGNSCKNWSAIK